MFERCRQFIRSAFWPAITFALLFFFAEIYFLIYPQPRPVKPYSVSFYTHDGERISTSEGEVKLALAPYTLYKTLPDQHLGYLNVNSDGFRGPELGEKKEDRLRVMLLGASTAFGFGAASDEDTFAMILDRSGGRFEVINASVIGFVSGQERSYLTNELLRYQPDWVVTFDGYADIFDAWHLHTALGVLKSPREMAYNLIVMPQIEDELKANFRTQSSPWAAFTRFARTALFKSFLIRRLNEQVEKAEELASRKLKLNQRDYTPLPDEYFDRVVDGFTGNLLEIARWCENRGVRYTSVLQPDITSKRNRTPDEEALLSAINELVPHYRKHYGEVYRRFMRRSHEVLLERGLDVIDIAEQPAFAYDGETLFVDSAHFNAEGNRVIASILRDALRRRDARAQGKPAPPETDRPVVRMTEGYETAPVDGYAAAKIDGATNAPIRIEAEPGRGIRLVAKTPILTGSGPVLIECLYSVERGAEGASVLSVHDSKAPNHLAYHDRALTAGPPGSLQRLRLLYDPASGGALPSFAVTVPDNAKSPATVVFRGVSSIQPVESGDLTPLELDTRHLNEDGAGGVTEIVNGEFRFTVGEKNSVANARVALPALDNAAREDVIGVRAAAVNVSRSTGVFSVSVAAPGERILSQHAFTPRQATASVAAAGDLVSRRGDINVTVQIESSSPSPSQWTASGVRAGRFLPKWRYDMP
ncbi:MAG: hypothetical protein GC154_11460 [bacterium]|nr:hypothetical protein [bacterium]